MAKIRLKGRLAYMTGIAVATAMLGSSAWVTTQAQTSEDDRIALTPSGYVTRDSGLDVREYKGSVTARCLSDEKVEKYGPYSLTYDVPGFDVHDFYCAGDLQAEGEVIGPDNTRAPCTPTIANRPAKGWGGETHPISFRTVEKSGDRISCSMFQRGSN